MEHSEITPAPPRSIADYQSLIAEGIGKGDERRRDDEREERAAREALKKEAEKYEADLARRGRAVWGRCDIEQRTEKLKDMLHGSCLGINVVQCDAEHAYIYGIPSNRPKSMLVMLRILPKDKDSDAAVRLLVARLIGEFSESPVGAEVEWNPVYSVLSKEDLLRVPKWERDPGGMFEIPLEWKGDWNAIAKEERIKALPWPDDG